MWRQAHASCGLSEIDCSIWGRPAGESVHCSALTNFGKMAMHPGRRINSILHELLAINRRKHPAKRCDMVRGDSFFAEITECLNHKTGSRAGCCHVLRCGALQLDCLISNSDRLLRAVCEINNLGWHLLRQT